MPGQQNSESEQSFARSDEWRPCSWSTSPSVDDWPDVPRSDGASWDDSVPHTSTVSSESESQSVSAVEISYPPVPCLPGSKKISNNGFMCLVQAMMVRDRMSLQRAKEKADLIWPTMDDTARKPYHDQAQEDRGANPRPLQSCLRTKERLKQLHTELLSMRQAIERIFDSLEDLFDSK